MENFYINTRKFDKVCVFVFSILFLTVGFLQASSLTFGKPIISFIQWPAVALGCLIILERLINFKHYLNTRGIILLFIFALSYAASSIWTIRYGWYENVRYLVFMVFQFGILYATDVEDDEKSVSKRLLICFNYYLIGTAVLSLLSFIFMFANCSATFYPEAGAEGPIYYIGFMNGRLFGAYWDPNIAATMAAVAVMISAYFIIKTKNIPLRIIYILSAILQVLYIAFSGSRTGQLSLIAGTLIFVVPLAIKHRFFDNKILQSLVATAVIIMSVTLSCFAPRLAREGYNAILHMKTQSSILPPNNSMQNPDHNNKNEANKDDTSSIPDDVFNRGYDMSEDISNRRFDIWKSAVEIFKTSPVLGVSRANILPYVDDNLPDSYLVTNDHMRFDSMHNMYFEILASQGALGFITFFAFIVCIIAGIIKYFKYLWKHENFMMLVLILSVIASVCMSTLVMAEIVYVTSPASIIFWIALGSLAHSISKKKAENKKL